MFGIRCPWCVCIIFGTNKIAINKRAKVRGFIPKKHVNTKDGSNEKMSWTISFEGDLDEKMQDVGFYERC
ncbi:hypothetical protein ACTXT7_005018 [Hymenolepis weldensis]